MKTQTIRLPSDNALRCRALAQENAALRASESVSSKFSSVSVGKPAMMSAPSPMTGQWACRRSTARWSISAV